MTTGRPQPVSEAVTLPASDSLDSPRKCKSVTISPGKTPLRLGKTSPLVFVKKLPTVKPAATVVVSGSGGQSKLVVISPTSTAGGESQLGKMKTGKSALKSVLYRKASEPLDLPATDAETTGATTFATKSATSVVTITSVSGTSKPATAPSIVIIRSPSSTSVAPAVSKSAPPVSTLVKNSAGTVVMSVKSVPVGSVLTKPAVPRLVPVQPKMASVIKLRASRPSFMGSSVMANKPIQDKWKMLTMNRDPNRR